MNATVKLTSFRRSLAVVCAFAALAVSTVSLAAPASDAVPSVAVSFADLDLASTAGVETLYRRISHAAREVCPDIHSRDLAAVAAGERCQSEAIARAVRDLNNPALALVHASRVSHG